MDVRAFLSRVELELDAGAVREAQQALWGALDDAKKSSLPATPSALDKLYLFKVPKLSPDGSCSLHEELDPTPYDLSRVLGGRSPQTSFTLLTLRALVEAAYAATGAAWLGLYQVRGDRLVKLAYRGDPSRAEFPLTAGFEAKSTNVRVTRSGVAAHIADVAAHREAGGAYYECDPKVRSELCVPVLDAAGKVTGLVDAEARDVAHFNPQRAAMVAALALEAAAHLPPL
jgi:putative methionine-R-sulfoxide reductase with GAF domain